MLVMKIIMIMFLSKLTLKKYIGTDHTVNTYYMGLEYSELYNIIKG